VIRSAVRFRDADVDSAVLPSGRRMRTVLRIMALVVLGVGLLALASYVRSAARPVARVDVPAGSFVEVSFTQQPSQLVWVMPAHTDAPEFDDLDVTFAGEGGDMVRVVRDDRQMTGYIGGGMNQTTLATIEAQRPGTLTMHLTLKRGAFGGGAQVVSGDSTPTNVTAFALSLVGAACMAGGVILVIRSRWSRPVR